MYFSKINLHATENGLYLAVSGDFAASRDPEHDTIAELSGGLIVSIKDLLMTTKYFFVRLTAMAHLVLQT